MFRISSLAALLSLSFGLAACDSPEPKAKPKTAQAGEKAKKPGEKPGEKLDSPDTKAKAPGATPAADSSDEDATANDVEEPGEPEVTDDPELEGYDPRVARAASLAKNIESKPEEADSLLALAKLDREGLDALMYEIASDPDLTQQYRMARGI